MVFDLDGTLVDTLPDIQHALNRVLSEEGLRTISYEQGRTFVGGGAHNLIEKAFTSIGAAGDDPRIDPAFDRFIEYYVAEPAVRSRLFPGVREALNLFRDAGVSMGVCTNKPYDITLLVLDQMGIADYFGDAVLGGDSLPVRKPHADHLLAVLRLLDVAESQAAMVGDSETDVASARNAGLPVIAVDFGYTALAPHELKADRVISHFDELPAALIALGDHS